MDRPDGGRGNLVTFRMTFVSGSDSAVLTSHSRLRLRKAFLSSEPRPEPYVSDMSQMQTLALPGFLQSLLKITAQSVLERCLRGPVC